jgi:hypothetical protein
LRYFSQKNNEYIRNYSNTLEKESFHGGIIYESVRPDKENLLRWIYGIKREALH